MAKRQPIVCSLTGARTMGVELTPGAISAISPAAHAAREAGEEVKPVEKLPPQKIPRRSAAAKAAAAKQVR